MPPIRKFRFIPHPCKAIKPVNPAPESINAVTASKMVDAAVVVVPVKWHASWAVLYGDADEQRYVAHNGQLARLGEPTSLPRQGPGIFHAVEPCWLSVRSVCAHSAITT